MIAKLSAKAIFIILIFLTIIILISNYVNRNKKIYSEKFELFDPSIQSKTVGVNIEQNHPNGEKIKIIADLMEENKKEKFIKLINPITEIIKKNNVTKITSTYGYIINNYSKFKLDINVNIYNSKKQFALKTENVKRIRIKLDSLERYFIHGVGNVNKKIILLIDGNENRLELNVNRASNLNNNSTSFLDVCYTLQYNTYGMVETDNSNEDFEKIFWK